MFVVPKLQAAGWDSDPHSIAEQRSFTYGRIVVRGSTAQRKRGISDVGAMPHLHARAR
jgi:type I restriction enzyme R subunit